MDQVPTLRRAAIALVITTVLGCSTSNGGGGPGSSASGSGGKSTSSAAGTGGSTMSHGATGGAAGAGTSAATGTGGAGGAGTAAATGTGGVSTGGATGTGGAGSGGAKGGCATAADCPGTDTECATRTCTAGACGVFYAPSGTFLVTQTPGDCATRTCNGTGEVVLTYDAADAPSGGACPRTAWQPASAPCGAAPAAAPATSWADCSPGIDPTKNGGDLVWVNQAGFGPTGPLNCPNNWGWSFTSGPTGDTAIGTTCLTNIQHGVAVYERLNGSGAQLAERTYDYAPGLCDTDAFFEALSIDPTNDLSVTVAESCVGICAPMPQQCPSGASEVDAPDGTALSSPPTWTSPVGTLKVATSTTDLDLGCGSLPAAPGGSTFVTRVDAMGNCIYARALPLPNLGGVMDATGRVVLSGFVSGGPVDLGGGPLAPQGAQDLALAELDTAGNYLWSRRVGGPGASFTTLGWSTAPARVYTSASGDVYVLTTFAGPYPPDPSMVFAVDFGDGAVTALVHDPIVASYSPSGAPRWSRAYHFGVTDLQATIDGCGSLVVGSLEVLASNCPGPYGIAMSPSIARFAP